MACALSTPLDCHLTLSTHPTLHKTKKLRILCNSNTNKQSLSDQLKPLSTNTNKQSLSDQLKPLSTNTTPHSDRKPDNTKKSTWVNPTKPKRPVIQLHRQKRIAHTNQADLTALKYFTQKLTKCEPTQAAVFALAEEFPCHPDEESVILVLNALTNHWETSILFLQWVKAEVSIVIETVFYNLVFKALRFSGRFDVVEGLVNEMVRDGVVLDNFTYSTVISIAKRCGRLEKAIEWFEMMYKMEVVPDEVAYSVVLDVYAKMGKVEEALALYDRGRGNGWVPDIITFSVIGKMFGERGDYKGVGFVLQEMKEIGVRADVGFYNSVIDALGRSGNPRWARGLFEEMVSSGSTPNEKTLTSLLKIYGKARWGRDALELCERIEVNGWPVDFILCNAMLNVCADIGNEEMALRLFKDMKGKEGCKPNSWTYSTMLKMYGSSGNARDAMELFEEMCEFGVPINVMGCTSLIQCLGKAKRIDDLVRVYSVSIEKGVRPDDRLCGSLLSVLSMCDVREDADKVVACLLQANPKLVSFIELIIKDGTSFEIVKEKFKSIMGSTASEARTPFCNTLIDLCRNEDMNERAHELLYLGTLYGLYPGLHKKNAEEWSMDVRSLSVGAAHTAFEEWLRTLCKIIQRGEALPELFFAHTGSGTHKFSQGLANGFASHAEKLAAPFKQHEINAGCFVATRGELESWAQSRKLSSVI